MRWLTHRSFQFKLTAATLVALLAMFGLLVAQTWTLLEEELYGQLRNRIDRTNTLLVAAVSLPLAQRDYATLGDVLTASVGRNALDYVVIEDHLQRRVAAAGWPAGTAVPPRSLGLLDVGRDGRIHVRQPIALAGQKLGEAQYGVSLRFLEDAQKKLADQMLRIGAIGIVIGLLLLLPLGFWVSRRLGLLEAAAQQLAAGKLDERIDLPGDDELSHLADAFNHMADSLAGMIDNVRRSEARFHHAVQGSSDGIWDWDLEHGEYYFSPRYRAMLGHIDNDDDVLEHDREAMFGLIHPEDRPVVEAAMERHIKEHVPFDIEFRMRHRDGHYIWFRSRGQALWDADGRAVRFSGATSDVSDRREAQAALEQLAHYDALTQLPNRTLLADRMAMALAQTRRQGGQLAIGLIDLDGFKPVNDALGHDAGDQILIEVARRLREALREGDTVARLGGDEFVLVLSDQASQPAYERTLSRLLAVLAQPYFVADTTVALSASFGVTLFPDDDADADTLLRHADQAMYVAKQAGRNRWHFFDASVDRDMRARMEGRSRIEAALAAGEFVLYYQPKVNLRAGSVIGAEALIRWIDPTRGLVAPGEFLPLIEGSQLDIEVSEWVIGEALRQVSQWQAQGLLLGVSVNVPARHLQDPRFALFLEAALARHPAVAPHRLELEVLESAALDDVVGVSARMEACRKLGLRFALDDFGTGYASLAYLRRLPIEVLKIDQSFVRDMLTDPDDLAIVEGVIGLATAFRNEVIAEGVETMDHGVMLLHLGCDLAQGYGIARPMPAAQVPGWVAAWRPDPALHLATTMTLERRDLVLASAEVDHRRWIDEMVAGVQNDQRRAVDLPPLAATACRFGQWLHGDGRAAYAELAAFSAIGPLHDAVHALGHELAALSHEHRHAEAQQRLPDLLALRDQLIAQLHVLIGDIADKQRTGQARHAP